MKILLASALLIISLAVPVKAQTSTNTPPIQLPGISWDFLTNLPPAPTFYAAKIGIDTGAQIGNGLVEAEIKASYYLRTNWMFSGSIDMAPSSTVIDAFDLRAGYRYAWRSADVFGQIGGRRCWSEANHSAWQGGIFTGASWLPTTGGTWVLSTGLDILTSRTGSALNTRPEVRWFPLEFGMRF